ncbi:MAG: hypothetical protein E7594_00400 [Ruminococcaceae bacterium]|nr:hypothetical protein [Oscillospiraceae bacterium]
MSKTIVRICSVTTSVLLALYAICIVLNFVFTSFVPRGIPWLPAGFVLNMSVLIPTVVLLIGSIVRIKKKQGGVYDLISSIVTALICGVWLVVSTLYWIFSIYYNLQLTSAMMPSGWVAANSYVALAMEIFTSLVALYLLIVFVVNVLVSKKKWWQIKAELHKPSAAALLLSSNLIMLARRLFSGKLYEILGAESFIKFSNGVIMAQFALTVLLALALAVFVLVFGLILRKKTETQKPKAQTPEEQPFDLPAGVNADDLA